MDILNNLIAIQGAGIADLWNNVLLNWITPLYLAAVAIFAIIFLKDRAWMKLIGFVGIAAVVGVLVFGGKALFGSTSSGLTGVATGAANSINTILPNLTMFF
jgi:hypothetical protein